MTSTMDWLWVIVIGFAGGLSGGMLGIGGSTVMIPCLTILFGPQHQHLHQAVGMIVTFFVVSAAVIEHRRAGAIMAPVVRRMVPGAVLFVLVGVRISEWSAFRGNGQAYLAAVFGLMLAYIVLGDAYALVRGRGETAPASPGSNAGHDGPRVWLIGIVAGLLGGLTGVGGGFIAVPLQRKLLGIPLRSAIANSAATIVALSVVGACYKNYALMRTHGYAASAPLSLALMLIPSAVAGSLLGSRLTHVLPVRVVHGVFSAVLAVAAVRLMMYPFEVE